MKAKKFFGIFEKGLKELGRNWRIVVLSVLLGFLLFVVSKIGLAFAPSMETTFANIVWTIFFGVISIILISYFSAGLIAMAKKSIKEKAGFKEFTSKASLFWFRNFLIVLVIVLISIAIGRIAHYGALFAGKALELGVNTAVFLFVLIYFAELIGILMFFTFSNVFLIVKDLSVWASVKNSARFVKKEYLPTLCLSIVFFVIYYFVNLIPGIFGDFVAYAFVVPFAVLVLTRFVVKGK
jgi:hypothetical protein